LSVRSKSTRPRRWCGSTSRSRRPGGDHQDAERLGPVSPPPPFPLQRSYHACSTARTRPLGHLQKRTTGWRGSRTVPPVSSGTPAARRGPGRPPSGQRVQDETTSTLVRSPARSNDWVHQVQIGECAAGPAPPGPGPRGAPMRLDTARQDLEVGGPRAVPSATHQLGRQVVVANSRGPGGRSPPGCSAAPGDRRPSSGPPVFERRKRARSLRDQDPLGIGRSIDEMPRRVTRRRLHLPEGPAGPSESRRHHARELAGKVRS